MGDGSGINGEENAVEEGVTGGEVSWRVSLVTGFVKHGVIVDDLQDLITVTSVIPNVVIVDDDVSGVPGVGVPNREYHWGGDEGAEETVKDTVEGIDERISSNDKLVPVKGGEGVDADAANAAGNRG